jgi:hypothetical protein
MLSKDVKLSGKESMSNCRFGLEISAAFGNTKLSANTGDITAISQSVFFVSVEVPILVSKDVPTSSSSYEVAC